MFAPLQLDPGRTTMSVVAVVASVLIIVGTTYKYVYGDESREQFYLSSALGLSLLSYFVGQLVYLFSGRFAVAVEAVSVIAFLGCLVVVALWMRLWRSGK